MMEISDEEWLPVVGYEATYAVSSMGRVCSWPRRTTKGGLLRPAPTPRGYLKVILCQLNGRGRTCDVHKIVLAAFIGEPPPDMETRHLDGNRTNNVLTNLRYGTKAENRQDMIDHGHDHNRNKTHCPQGHPYDAENTYRIPSSGGRQCRICGRESDRRHRQRRSAQRNL